MKFFMVFLLAMPLMLIGCATNKATINTVTDPGYSNVELESIAVFPIRNARLVPSESLELNRKITSAIAAKNPKIRLLGATEATSLLNEKGLSSDWAKFVENYFSSGVPDAALLKKIGSGLGVQGIIQGEIVNLVKEDGAYGRNAGQTRITVRYTLFGVAQGRSIWESTSDGIRKTATTVSEAPPTIEAVNLAVDKIIESFPPF